ncbi:MAG: ATP-binding cassette domain-containing protein [Actinobacteria bacterium]|nr:ATP-binding cassette domain-containing protein [Actinomycetota bacterium]
MTDSSLLQLIDGVIARGQQTLLSKVNISVNAGELALLTGPNGSGKSTLLTALAGEKFLASGSLSFGATPRSEISLKDMAVKRSLMLQQDEAVDTLRAKDVIELADISNIAPQYAKEFVSKIFNSDLREKTLGTLSTGQRTQTFLAAAAIQNASIMLLDEPTAGLDADAISVLPEFLIAHISNGGAVILATHEDNLRSLASKEFVIHDEKLTVRELS